MVFISLKYDFAFKHIMRNEEVRKHFISDILEIPLSEIRSVRLLNPFLWKRHRRQKEGILDILLELNDDTKINIELQIKFFRHLDRRILFYLSKMFTEELLTGEKYAKLKKCINITILDFNLDDRPEYHKVYRLRDEKCIEFSDVFEIHIIELRKTLNHTNEPLNDWIRLFNAMDESDLNNIKTDNPGILNAIKEAKVMGLVRRFRAEYEAYLKRIRDRSAWEDYARESGMEAGTAKGIEIAKISLVRKKAAKNISIRNTADLLEEDIAYVEKLYHLIQSHPSQSDDEIYHILHEKDASAALLANDRND